VNISHTKHMFSFLSTTSSKLGPPTYAILNTEAAYPKTIDRRARVLTSVTIHCVCFVLYLAYEKKKQNIEGRASPRVQAKRKGDMRYSEALCLEH